VKRGERIVCMFRAREEALTYPTVRTIAVEEIGPDTIRVYLEGGVAIDYDCKQDKLLAVHPVMFNTIREV